MMAATRAPARSACHDSMSAERMTAPARSALTTKRTATPNITITTTTTTTITTTTTGNSCDSDHAKS